MSVIQSDPPITTPAAAKPRTEKRGELLIDRPVESTRPANVKLFVLVVILMTVSPLGLGLGLGNFAPRLPSLDWTLLIDQRTSALAESIHVPKVIFVGGSNLRFGLDADALSRDLGMPVINYGLHASLGIDVIADRAALVIKPGDIVVYAPELSHFRRAEDATFSDDLRIDFLSAHPSSTVEPRLQSFPIREWNRARGRCNRIRAKGEKVFATFFDSMTGTDKPEASDDANGKALLSPYEVSAIGPHGELDVARPGPRPYDRWQMSDPPTSLDRMDLTSSRGMIGFDRLLQVCQERRATLCVMPPMRLAVTRLDQPLMLKMEQAFCDTAVAAGARLIMLPGENILPVEYGYDTDYHLNDRGVAMMQPRIEAALRTVIPKTKISSENRLTK